MSNITRSAAGATGFVKNLAASAAGALSAGTSRHSTATASVHTSASGREKTLTKQSLPGRVLKTEYAVRGRVVTRSYEIQKMLAEKTKSLPFDELIFANIGNPQAVGATPLTFPRQVLACVMYPPLLEAGVFPEDVIKRAKEYLKYANGKVGAYSHSKGLEGLRQEVADWLEVRDGHRPDAEHIFLQDGASPAVKLALDLLIGGPEDALLIPLPQYPLYSASITKLEGTAVGYYLDEEKNWGTSREELERALKEGRDQGKKLKALVVINPGNPTGGILSKQDMEEIVEFCEDNNLVLLADEVYQVNIYKEGAEFTSFRKVVMDKGSSVELFSFHSASKGIAGECGLRGGCVVTDNLDPEVLAEMYKLASVNLCANIIGQMAFTLTVRPPKAGEASYELYKKELGDALDSLKRRAKKVAATLNGLEGASCQEIEGAMYAFPSITVPKKAAEMAMENGMAPDLFYCLRLLEETGIVVVPGSGFGQRDGTFHFRTTILPQENQVDAIAKRMSEFHSKFMKDFS